MISRWPEAADMVVMLLDLLEHLVGRAGEHDAGLDRAVDGALLGAGVLIDCARRAAICTFIATGT